MKTIKIKPGGKNFLLNILFNDERLDVERVNLVTVLLTLIYPFDEIVKLKKPVVNYNGL